MKKNIFFFTLLLSQSLCAMDDAKMVRFLLERGVIVDRRYLNALVDEIDICVPEKDMERTKAQIKEIITSKK